MSTTQALAPVAPQSFGEAMRIGEVLAESGFFADTPTAAKAIVKMLAGRELGFGPIQSMTGVDIIQGQVAIKPQLMASAIQRSGRFGYEVHEGHPTEQECSIDFYERGSLLGTSTFTMADATKAGLAGKQSWKQYPRNMLWARAMRNGANWYCAGIFGGPVYTPEELGAEVNAEGEVIVGSARPDAVQTPAEAKEAAPGSGPVDTPSTAPTDSLDAAIAAGRVEGLETPSDASPAGDDQPPAPEPASAPAPTDAPPVGTNGNPAALAAEYGIAPSTQRLILLNEGGLEDATDLEAAYRALPAENQDAVIRALAKKAQR